MMNNDEQSMKALEDELRTLAARDREGAAELADSLAERMQSLIDRESRHSARRQFVYRMSTAAASLITLAVAGSLLLSLQPDERPVSKGGEHLPEAIVQTCSGEEVAIAPAAVAITRGAGMEVDSVANECVKLELPPESGPVMKVRGMSSPTAANGSACMENSVQMTPEQIAALRAEIAAALAQELHPYERVMALFDRLNKAHYPGKPRLYFSSAGTGVLLHHYTDVLKVAVKGAHTSSYFELKSPQDTLPDELRAFFAALAVTEKK